MTNESERRDTLAGREEDRFCSDCEIEKIPVEVEGTAKHGPHAFELRCPECDMIIQSGFDA